MKLYPLIVAAIVLGGCTPAFADEFSVGAGKMLNNTNTKIPGWVASVEYAHTTHLWNASVRARFMKADRSHLSEWGNSTFESVAVAKDFGQWTASFGEVVYMNYDTRVEWRGQLYAHDLTHYSKHCWNCGQVTTLGYRFGKSRFTLEGQYYAVQTMCPTYQGVVMLLKYDIYRSEP